MRIVEWLLCGAMAVVLAPGVTGQQVGDTLFVPELSTPAFSPGTGPRVLVDEGHGNFHTLSGRFQSFARLVELDGFLVKEHPGTISGESLRDADLLVIANALNERNVGGVNWTLPTPSAFSDSEVESVRSWVSGGGALLLIADHMPFPGAAMELARAFGFELNNGFAVDTTAQGPLVFRRSGGSLGAHSVTQGTSPGESIDSIATFTGEGFRAPPEATVLLELPGNYVSLMPEVAWEFGPETPRVDVGGWAQGAVLEYGEGRVAVFGEAAMFTAQRTGPERRPMGMNAPIAHQNPQFVVNLVRWLTKVR